MKFRRFIPWLAAAALAGAALAGYAHEANKKSASRVALPAVHTAQGEQCVEPTDVMRRDHMKFILHQRDETVQRGIRTTKHSLKECVDCHADPKTNSVVGEEGFCSSCHIYTAVSIDCFACHTPKRSGDAAKAANTRSADGEHLVNAIAAAVSDTRASTQP